MKHNLFSVLFYQSYCAINKPSMFSTYCFFNLQSCCYSYVIFINCKVCCSSNQHLFFGLFCYSFLILSSVFSLSPMPDDHSFYYFLAQNQNRHTLFTLTRTVFVVEGTENRYFHNSDTIMF